jgi:hypothetical protein
MTVLRVSEPWRRNSPPGRHTMSIRVTGEKHGESSNTSVQIAGCEVRGQ